MRPSVIEKIIEKAKQSVVIIHYNKPYLEESSSVYAGKKELFKSKHNQYKKEIEYLLIKNNFVTYKLLDEDYYYVSVLTK